MGGRGGGTGEHTWTAGWAVMGEGGREIQVVEGGGEEYVWPVTCLPVYTWGTHVADN